MKISFIKLLVDISGSPKTDNSGNYQKVIVVATSVDRYNFMDVIDRFKSKFYGYWDKKGHQLSPDKLEEIVAFLDAENIRMITVQFDTTDWDKYKTKCKGEANLEEKIMGILYYYVLKRVASKRFVYQVLIDNDTSFNIKQSIIICQRISREGRYNFDISFGYRAINQELRFPDWIASARRRCDVESLKKYKHFIILKNELPPYHLNRILRKSKI